MTEISDVLYVPDASANLMSVSCAVKKSLLCCVF